jgi:transcription termination/antitermination protein NusA
MVIISRTCPEFLARLFELEVPEIFDKTVRIVKVVRDPGHRSKIAVTTNDSRVDPVGACVGMRGNRVQAIVRELSNERIDIINWTEEMSLLVRRVFSPAEVKRVIPAGEKRIVVVIREEDLAQAIGREGQNIRLGSKMIDKEIDVFGDDEFNAMTEEQRANLLSETPQPSAVTAVVPEAAVPEAAGSEAGAVPEAADAGSEKKTDAAENGAAAAV